MSIVINGSGTVTGLAVGGLPDGTVDAGTLATNSVDSAELIDGSIDTAHIAANQITSAIMPTGSVLQVVQGISTINIASTTADTWIDAVTVNITPSSTSSKIYVSFNINAMIISDNQRGGVRMARNSTGIGVATNVQSRIASSATFAGTSDGALRSKNMSNSVLDSPSTTSQITYRLQYHCENTTEVKINHDDADGNADSYYRSASTITVMEIAG